MASGPDSWAPGGGGPASTGEGVLAPRRSPRTPPAQAGVTRSRSAARPRPARPLPPEQQYLQISPGQRLVPRPSAPSPSRGRRRSHCRPAGPPPPRPSPKPPAALTGLPRRGGAGDPASPLLLRLLFFVAGVSGRGGGKWKSWALGPSRPAKAQEWDCRECSGRRLSPRRLGRRRRRGLGPGASAALAVLLRLELAGAAHSSTGGRAAHPTRAAAARGTRPLRRPRAPAGHAHSAARARGRLARPAPWRSG